MKRKFLNKLPIVIIAIVGILFIAMIVAPYTNTKERVCTVSEKYVKNDKEKSKYMVVCGDVTYKVSDETLLLKFNSSDIYGKIKVGYQYKVKSNGFRIPIMSEYENIYEVEQSGNEI